MTPTRLAVESWFIDQANLTEACRVQTVRMNAASVAMRLLGVTDPRDGAEINYDHPLWQEFQSACELVVLYHEALRVHGTRVQ